MKRTIASVGWIFAVIGMAFIAGGGAVAWRTQRFLDTATHADGVVVGLVRSGSRGRSFAPVVEFATAEGRRVQFQSNISSSPPAYDVGEHIGVWYSPTASGEA